MRWPRESLGWVLCSTGGRPRVRASIDWRPRALDRSLARLWDAALVNRLWWSGIQHPLLLPVSSGRKSFLGRTSVVTLDRSRLARVSPVHRISRKPIAASRDTRATVIRTGLASSFFKLFLFFSFFFFSFFSFRSFLLGSVYLF